MVLIKIYVLINTHDRARTDHPLSGVVMINTSYVSYQRKINNKYELIIFK